MDSTTLDGKSFIYSKFPEMTLNSKSCYIKYKVNDFKNLLEKNPNYNFNIVNLRKDFNIENILGIKEIIDNCIENGILVSNGTYWNPIPNTKMRKI